MRTRSLLLAALVAGVPRLALAYPIPPQTVWDLSRKAQAIVLARVLLVRDADKSTVDLGDAPSGVSFGSYDAIAELQVLSALKGRVSERLEVRYAPGMICPAPPRYVAGTTVLAFLERGESDRWYRTVGLSYGVRYVEPGDERDLTRMVQSAVRGRDAGRRAWAVEAATLPALRWDGLYEIDRRGDVVRSFYDRPDAHAPIVLEKRELQALARSFVRDPPRDLALPQMLGLLAGHPDPAVDATAISLIDELLASEEGESYWVDEALELLLDRLGLGMSPVVPEQGDPLFGVHRPGAESRRERWYALRAQLGPAPRLPAAAARPPRGVGGHTPP